MRELIYKGIKIEKIENMNYEFKFLNTYNASRIATARAIIDGLLSNCEGSTELVSVCEFQPSKKIVFDWGEQIQLKFVPTLINHLHDKNDFIVVEWKRSDSTSNLIQDCFNEGFNYFN